MAAAYLVREDGFEAASPEAAAAAAAATSLSRLHPQKSGEFQAALQEYLKGLAGSRDALALGTQLGQRAAQRVLDSRAADGATAPDPYRPRTTPGAYVPTATMVCTSWPTLKPFVLERPDQFHPGPPVALSSRECYRSSTRVGTAMGQAVGQYVATHFAPPGSQPARSGEHDTRKQTR